MGTPDCKIVCGLRSQEGKCKVAVRHTRPRGPLESLYRIRDCANPITGECIAQTNEDILVCSGLPLQLHVRKRKRSTS